MPTIRLNGLPGGRPCGSPRYEVKGRFEKSMRTKARLLFIAMAAGLLLGGVAAWGQNDLYYQSASQTHIAPDPIAIKAASGATLVGMNEGRWRANLVNQDISSMTLQLEGDVDWADIGLVRVYYSTDTYNPASPGTRIDDNNGGAGYYFTSSTLTVNMDISTFTIGTGPNNFITVAFDFDAGTDTSRTAAVEITALVNGPNGVGTGGTHDPLGTISTTSNLDDYEATVTATDIAPATAEQTQQDVPVLKILVDPVEREVTLDSIKVHAVGSPRDDNDVGSAELYLDDGDGTFEPGVGAGLDGDPIATTTVAGGYATLNPTANETIAATGKTYFVAVDVGSVVNADVGHVIGFEVQNPSTDIVFLDVDILGYNLNYTNQKGYITQATPTANGTFDIIAFVPFVVSEWTPTDGSTGVLRESNVTAKFSEAINETTLVYDSTIYLKDSGGTTVPAALTYSALTRTATINPTANLEWGETYTATVTTGVQNDVGDYLEYQKQWSFTVEAEVHPYVTSTIPASGATGVSKSSPGIRATFSEQVFNVTTTTFTLVQVGFGAVAGTVAEEGGSGGTVWNFTPTVLPLIDGVEYQVTIKGTGGSYVYDDDGLALVASSGSLVPADKVWSFWTAPDIPPAVLAVSPAEDATGVPINATISAVFSKVIKDSTLAGNFQVRDPSSTLVAGTIEWDSGSNTATFTPTAQLNYNRVYTVTLTTGITDEEDNPITAEKVWSFKTFGEFPEPIAIRNRIQPGVNDHTLIFIPEPPAGPNERVTVQVFTPTGKRVDTLVSAQRYSDIVADLPLAWYGKNGRDEDLGPGLYFIKVSAGKWSRTLKVMIVR